MSNTDGESDTALLISTTEEPQIYEQYEEARESIAAWMEDIFAEMPEEMDVEEAGQFIKPLQLTGNLHEDVHLWSRFMMGVAARRVRESTEHGNVMDALEELVDRFGLGTSQTLRRCINGAETFHDNPKLFAKWLKTGEKKRWYHFIEAGRANVDPSALGAEAFDQYIQDELDNIERTAERASEVAAEISEDNEERLREVEGVITALTTAAEELRRESREAWERAQIEDDEEEKERLMSKALDKFEEMLREMPCLACGKMPTQKRRTEPHHVASSVTAKKLSHWFRCPLCYDCHMIIEDNPHSVFKERTGFDVRGLTARTLHIWITGHDVAFPSQLQ